MPKKLREILEASDKPFNEFMKRRDAMTTEPTTQIVHSKGPAIFMYHGGGDWFGRLKDGEYSHEELAKQIKDIMDNHDPNSIQLDHGPEHRKNVNKAFKIAQGTRHDLDDYSTAHSLHKIE